MARAELVGTESLPGSEIDVVVVGLENERVC